MQPLTVYHIQWLLKDLKYYNALVYCMNTKIITVLLCKYNVFMICTNEIKFKLNHVEELFYLSNLSWRLSYMKILMQRL